MPRLGLTVAMVVLLVGCTATQQVAQVETLTGLEGSARILLFEPDIKFYLLTAGGVSEPQPDWTETARRNFLGAAREHATEQKLNLRVLDTAIADETLTQYEKLHQAVGNTALVSYLGPYKLPSKQGAFDLTLGPGVSVLKERYGADYGLFVFYRDYRSSGGRMAFAVLAAVAGVGMGTGNQYGFASLVDLTTGDLVWVNRVDVGTGDLREADGAARTVDVLFEDMPHG